VKYTNNTDHKSRVYMTEFESFILLSGKNNGTVFLK